MPAATLRLSARMGSCAVAPRRDPDPRSPRGWAITTISVPVSPGRLPRPNVLCHSSILHVADPYDRQVAGGRNVASGRKKLGGRLRVHPMPHLKRGIPQALSLERRGHRNAHGLCAAADPRLGVVVWPPAAAVPRAGEGIPIAPSAPRHAAAQRESAAIGRLGPTIGRPDDPDGLGGIAEADQAARDRAAAPKRLGRTLALGANLPRRRGPEIRPAAAEQAQPTDYRRLRAGHGRTACPGDLDGGGCCGGGLANVGHVRTIPHRAFDSNANAEYQLCNRCACSGQGRMYLSDMSRAHGAAAEMVEAKMNSDLKFLVESASSVYTEMREAAEKAVRRGDYNYASFLYRIAGSAARIAAEQNKDMEDFFYNTSIDCDANAYYYESLSEHEEV